MPAPSESVSILVVIDHTVYTGSGGFSVLSAIQEPSNEKIHLVSSLNMLSQGARYRLTGKWIQDRRYGRQFRVESCIELRPESREGLIRFFVGHFRGIGPALATRIVTYFGVDVLDVLDAHPERLGEVPGIGRKTLQSMLEQWSVQKRRAGSLVFLHGLGISAGTAQKIIEMYGDSARGIIEADPYRLSRDIRGIGFLRADAISMRIGIARDSPLRLRAGIHYELSIAEENGHTCLPFDKLVSQSAQRLAVPAEQIRDIVNSSILAGELAVRKTRSDDRLVFTRTMDHLEQELADNLKRLSKARVSGVEVELEVEIRRFEKEFGITLDDSQRTAVRTVTESSIAVLTGGPGTGKTTLVRLILGIFRSYQIRLAAPTGRAAQRMNETTGCHASTLHRLLEFDPKSGRFNYHAGRKLPLDVLIVDETSMVDLTLAAALLRALPTGCRLICVGDADQLPSVGAGRVLADLIESGLASVARLSHIFRQSGMSRIVRNAHRIIRGEMPEVDRADTSADFFFVAQNDPERALAMVPTIIHRLVRRLRIDPIDDIQFLCPMYRGILGVDSLNGVLRDLLNPGGRDIRIGPTTFRSGDKVMQIRNNYEHDIYNGDIGKIRSILTEPPGLRIRFGRRDLDLHESDLEQIVPAYACSIHKAQGSEYPAVVIMLHTQHFIMLRRNLLYTAVTRGKRMVVLLGSWKALAIAVKNNRMDERYSMLSERILEAKNLLPGVGSG